MHITLDQDSINQAVQQAVNAAITEGVSSWDLKHAIAEHAKVAISDADLPGKVASVLRDYLAADIDLLVAEAVVHALPALRLATTEAVQHLAASMLFGLRNGRPSAFDTHAVTRWEDCLAIARQGLHSPAVTTAIPEPSQED